MKILSPNFLNNEDIPSKFTCDGDDVNPELIIEDVPEKAASLAIICDDPDSPTGLWLHWILWNISPKTKIIKENSAPDGAISGINDFGNFGYGGPCPGRGKHHYCFKIFALDTELNLSQNSKQEDLGRAMEGHILEQRELVGLYERRS